MTPGVRKLALTVHVTSSVGWLGAVVAFLALAIAGVSSRDPQLVRGAYLTMELLAWYAILPLSLASLASGLVQSLVTVWGLFRHYWVLAKLVINVFASFVLLLYLETLGSLADLASETSDLGVLRSPIAILHAGVALLLLLIATVLAVYKPRGLTPYGWRKQQERLAASIDR